MSKSEPVDLIPIQTLTPAIVFSPGGVDRILEKLKADVRAISTDISTPSGRKEIASVAFKIARSKTALDEMGKTLVADLKKQTGSIDAERRRIRDELDALKDEFRKPLTDWEKANEDRIAAHEYAIGEIERAGHFLNPSPTTSEVEGRIAHLARLKNSGRNWEEFHQRSDLAFQFASTNLLSILAVVQKREAEQAGLERLRKERAEQEQRERDARIAETARLEAEAVARREAEAAATRAKAEQDRIERERVDAERRAQKAEEDRIAAEKRAEQARIDAEIEAEENRRRMREEAERSRLRAIEDERRRIAEEKATADAETARREADKQHRGMINREIVEALLKLELASDEPHARRIVTALARGKICHVKVTY